MIARAESALDLLAHCTVTLQRARALDFLARCVLSRRARSARACWICYALINCISTEIIKTYSMSQNIIRYNGFFRICFSVNFSCFWIAQVPSRSFLYTCVSGRSSPTLSFNAANGFFTATFAFRFCKVSIYAGTCVLASNLKAHT